MQGGESLWAKENICGMVTDIHGRGVPKGFTNAWHKIRYSPICLSSSLNKPLFACTYGYNLTDQLTTSSMRTERITGRDCPDEPNELGARRLLLWCDFQCELVSSF